MAAVGVWTQSSAFNVVWPGFVSWPAEDIEHLRRWQLMVLGRYGHQQVSQWVDEDVEEITVFVEVLIEVVNGEKSKLATEAENLT